MQNNDFKKLKEIYQTMLEAPIDKVWYHGTPNEISRFSDDFVGNGVDQEGPGIYFTDNEEDAYSYSRKEGSDGFVYKVYLNFKKIVPSKGRVPKKEIIQLINWAPDLEDKLMNWDENIDVAKQKFLAAVNRNKTPKEQFLTVWYDLYRYQPIEYVRNMVTLEYDGLLVKRGFLNTTHAVVYNPKIIEVIRD